LSRPTRKKARPIAIRPHAARVIKLAEYPVHVNGGYLDDPDRIATIGHAPRRER
jgi:hypothetical protein